MAEIIDTSSYGNDDFDAADAPSQYRVSFNNNVVDGGAMEGGYQAWQLLPYGSKAAPVTEKNGPYTLTDTEKLVFFGTNNKRDIFVPSATTSFKRDEDVTISGPEKDDDDKPYIMMKGLKTGTTITWTWVGTK